jgi:uncharacterized protein (DUF983 family)
MMVPEMTATQTDTARLMVRQTETALLAMNTAYRDGHPGEIELCPACNGGALFVLRPDGQLQCDDCGATTGRWAMRKD